MNKRVSKLRQQSLDIPPYVSSERAELITDFYMSGVPMQVSKPVCRALSFRYILENKSLCVNEGELIVGERGTGPKATPTYPELCCHDLEDFRIMSTRDRTRYDVCDDVMKVYEEKIIPFWTGKTMREKLFKTMSKPWQQAYDAGVFTEFMEQRAPGHAIMDDKIYKYGMIHFKERIAESREKLDFLNDHDAYDKDQQLEAMDITCDAIMMFARRYEDKVRQLAAVEPDAVRKAELLNIAEICKHVPANAPRTFHEALQMYWFIHLGVISELNTWDSFNPGRLDYNLYPFYKQQLESGELTKEQAEELLQCFWVKFHNHPAPPKVGITEEASGTYTDFALINVGGVHPESGADAVNELSYMILDVVEEMRMVQPSSCIQLSAKNPDSFLKRACEVVRAGFGQPSIFNTDVIIKEMLYNDKNMVDARTGGPSGCVTISAFGKESCTLTGYYNWAKVFELACNNGKDPVTGDQIGPETGDARQFTSYEQFMDAYKAQLIYFADMKIEGNNLIERLFAMKCLLRLCRF
jgi:pyruvate-formate lyase